MAYREAGDWISSYIEYTKNTEPKQSFHTWTGISVLAAVLQRRVWMQWGHQKIFPNMYVVLCGTSGRARKGTAMGIGSDLLRKVTQVKMVSESVTREALIKSMQDSVTNFVDPQYPSNPQLHCAVTIFSEELAVFLGQGDIKFLSNLTDWYDSKDVWTYETKGKGREEINGVCINLLGATAPDWLQSILPQEAVGGGFTSRVIFVVEESKGKTVPDPQLSAHEIALRSKLIEDLEQISALAGPYEFTPEAKNLYEEWYTNEDTKIARGNSPVPDPRFSGYNERRPTHIKKLSMIMSASRGNDLMITFDDFERSRKLLEAVEVKMMRAFGGLGQSKYGVLTTTILDYIVDKKRMVKRSEILNRFYTDIDPESLEMIMKTLEQMKVVKVTYKIEDGEAEYTLIKKRKEK
jgi:hypothetical protein